MIKLYTTGCPRCMVLEKKLEAKKIEFEKVTDERVMLEKGFSAAPMLEADDRVMNFTEAVSWVNSR